MSQEPRAVSADPRLATRDGRKAILSSLGVDAATGDDYRLVLYRDGAQEVAFKGALDAGGRLILGHSAPLPLAGSVTAAESVVALTKGEFRRLPSPIQLPATATEKPWEKPVSGDPSAIIQLDAKALRRLMREVSILAEADSAASSIRGGKGLDLRSEHGESLAGTQVPDGSWNAPRRPSPSRA